MITLGETNDVLLKLAGTFFPIAPGHLQPAKAFGKLLAHESPFRLGHQSSSSSLMSG
jgi:hypothetical protein